jgi:hypothetical protein
MTRTTVSIEDHKDGILNALYAAGLAFPIGDHEVRLRGGLEVNPPYAILFLLTGGEQDGPINDSVADVGIRFQITGVGKTVVEAMRVIDQTRSVIKEENITITGRRVRRVIPISASSGAQRDDALPKPVFYCYDVWTLDTTPG